MILRNAEKEKRREMEESNSPRKHFMESKNLVFSQADETGNLIISPDGKSLSYAHGLGAALVDVPLLPLSEGGSRSSYRLSVQVDKASGVALGVSTWQAHRFRYTHRCTQQLWFRLNRQAVFKHANSRTVIPFNLKEKEASLAPDEKIIFSLEYTPFRSNDLSNRSEKQTLGSVQARCHGEKVGKPQPFQVDNSQPILKSSGGFVYRGIEVPPREKEAKVDPVYFLVYVAMRNQVKLMDPVENLSLKDLASSWIRSHEISLECS